MPARGPGEVLVRVEAVGICASDLKCYHGAAKFWGDDNRPAWAETEAIPGHEFVGAGRRARRRGAPSAGASTSATGWSSEQIVPCWKCRYCTRGKYHMCQPHDMYGFKRAHPGRHGGATWSIPAEALVHKISKRHPAGARRVRRAAVLRAARGRAGHDHLRRHRRRRRLRPDRPRHDRRRRGQVPAAVVALDMDAAKARAGRCVPAPTWRSTSPRRTRSPGSRS